MKKTDKVEDLKSEYTRKELGNGTRGKYFKSYNEANNLVLLRPEVAEVFATDEDVNEALLSLIKLARQSAGLKKKSA
jgi:hypothetical protein